MIIVSPAVPTILSASRHVAGSTISPTESRKSGSSSAGIGFRPGRATTRAQHTESGESEKCRTPRGPRRVCQNGRSSS